MTLSSPELTALLNSIVVWIEIFRNRLKIENTVWSYSGNKITLQVFLK